MKSFLQRFFLLILWLSMAVGYGLLASLMCFLIVFLHLYLNNLKESESARLQRINLIKHRSG